MTQQIDLAKLVVQMEAQSEKYLRDLAKQRAETNKWRKKTVKDTNAVKSAFKKLAVKAGVAASIAAMRSMTASSAALSKEIRTGAYLVGISTSEFQAHAYAVEQAGIPMDKYADQMKDVRERVGDFIASGAGPMVDFFENVAPKIGITADQLQHLSGPQILQTVKNAMDDANVSMEEQIFYLESLASDTTNLIPLLADNGKQLNVLTQEFKGLNAELSETDLTQLQEVELLTKKMDVGFTKLKATLVTQFAPGLIAAFGDVRNAITGVVDVAKWAGEEVASIFHGPAADDIVRIKERIYELQQAINNDSLWALGDRLRFFGEDGMIKFYSKDELREKLAEMQALAASYEENSPKSPTVISIDSATPNTAGKNRREFDLLWESLQTEEEAFAQSYERRLKIIEEAKKREAIFDSEAIAATKRLQQEKNDFIIAKENELLLAKMAVADATLDIGIGLAKDGSAIERGLLAGKHSMALFEAGMNLKVALSNALAEEFPANIAAYAKVANLGSTIVGGLESMSLPSYLGGGALPDGPRSGGADGHGGFPILAHPGEIVFDPMKGDIVVTPSTRDLGGADSHGVFPSLDSPVELMFEPLKTEIVVPVLPTSGDSALVNNDEALAYEINVHNYSGEVVEVMTEGRVIDIMVAQNRNPASRPRTALHKSSNVQPKGLR